MSSTIQKDLVGVAVSASNAVKKAKDNTVGTAKNVVVAAVDKAKKLVQGAVSKANTMIRKSKKVGGKKGEKKGEKKEKKGEKRGNKSRKSKK